MHKSEHVAHIAGLESHQAVKSENIHSAGGNNVRETFLSAQAEKYEQGLLLLLHLGGCFLCLNNSKNL